MIVQKSTTMLSKHCINNRYYYIIFSLIFLLSVNCLYAFQQDDTYTEYKGIVLDATKEEAIGGAVLQVENQQISSISNSEGRFSLKIPNSIKNATVTTSKIGYESKSVALNYFTEENMQVFLRKRGSKAESLEAVKIYKASNAQALVQKMLSKRDENYLKEDALYTAFYRETVKRGNQNVSLSEAVVSLKKRPYRSWNKENIAVKKARKYTDYSRLDTLAIKLRGGPYSTLYLDLMKYPDYLFYDRSINNYKFSLKKPTSLYGRYVHVVNFEDTNKNDVWYYGKLYIDAETYSIVKADYKLNVDNEAAATDFLVYRKPGNSQVTPLETHYVVNYISENGKWHYSYGKAVLKVKVNWDKKLFNSRYTISSEMMVTKEEKNTKNLKKTEGYIKPSVVMTDDISGFRDPEFWGKNNIIEPDKTIQNAIEKIKDR